jgi:pyridoxine kinase
MILVSLLIAKFARHPTRERRNRDTCAMHNSVRRAENQGFAHNFAASFGLASVATLGTVALMARILAISSHVAFGSVGLAAMVPALQWLGHEVLSVPSVILSSHPGYPRFAGGAVPVEQITAMVDAMEANGWFAETAGIITGYLPTPEHVRAARAAVERVRAANPQATYLCDPVFGDEPDGLYLPTEVANAIRDDLLPLADIASPNRFELGWLGGQDVTGPDEARRAAMTLGVPSLLATSVPASDNRLATILFRGEAGLACFVRRRPTAPHGTGDLLAAMYLGNHINKFSPAYCLGASTSAVDASVASSMGRDELPLAGSGALWANAKVLQTAPA